MTKTPWRQPPSEMENIRYPAANLYALKNVHGYACYQKERFKHVYAANAWSDNVCRASKQYFEAGLRINIHLTEPDGPRCFVCGGDPGNADHQYKRVRLSDDNGLLLNEDGTKLQIKHDRPNTVGRITGIMEPGSQS